VPTHEQQTENQEHDVARASRVTEKKSNGFSSFPFGEDRCDRLGSYGSLCVDPTNGCSTSPFRGTRMDPSFLDICRRAALFPSPFNLCIRYLCTAVLLVVVSLSFAYARHVPFVLHSRRLSSFRATRSIPLNISPALHKPLLFHFPSPLLSLSLLDYLIFPAARLFDRSRIIDHFCSAIVASSACAPIFSTSRERRVNSGVSPELGGGGRAL